MSSQAEKNIKLALILNVCFSSIELIGGLLTNSFSVSSDSFHDFGDCIYILISWLLEKKSTQKPNQFYSYGYQKFSVLGGLINSGLLIFGASLIFIGAIKRFFVPEFINYDGVLFLALLGGIFFLPNSIFLGKKLSKGLAKSSKEDLLCFSNFIFTLLFARVRILFTDFDIFNCGFSIDLSLDTLLSSVLT